MRVHTCALRKENILGKNEWNKWKNHLYEMKGGVGMSVHENERKQEDATPRHKLIHNPIPTSLFLSSPQCISYSQFNAKMFFLCLMHSQQTNKIQNRDVGMGL